MVYIINTEYSFEFLIALCHGDSAASQHQDRLFHASLPFADDVGFEVGQFRAWVVAEVVSLRTLRDPHHQGELSSPTLARPPSATIGRRQGWCSCCNILGVSSSVFVPPGPVHCAVQSNSL